MLENARNTGASAITESIFSQTFNNGGMMDLGTTRSTQIIEPP
jgi:hypothetical protein